MSLNQSLMSKKILSYQATKANRMKEYYSGVRNRQLFIKNFSWVLWLRYLLIGFFDLMKFNRMNHFIIFVLMII